MSVLAGMSVLIVLDPSGASVRRCVGAVPQFDLSPQIPLCTMLGSEWLRVKGSGSGFLKQHCSKGDHRTVLPRFCRGVMEAWRQATE